MSPRLYLDPNQEEDLQGDIFDLVPAVMVKTRQFEVAREFPQQDSHGRRRIYLHSESDPPRSGFTFAPEQGGEEQFVVHAFVTRGILLTHDCEIENDDRVRQMAMVRVLADLPDDAQESIVNGESAGAFLLPVQQETPSLPASFVDFRRITPVRPEILVRSEKHCSMTEGMRAAMAEHYWEYLFRPPGTPRGH